MPVTTAALVNEPQSRLLLDASAMTQALPNIIFFNAQRGFLCDTLNLNQRKTHEVRFVTFMMRLN
jgi:hypothetical protein